MATTAPLPYEFDGPRPGSRLEECGDETLARLVAEADEAAFAVLYERHFQALYRYCRSIVRDDLDAQDALQSAWTSVLVALRHGRRDAPVRPWLYRIVHNEAISALRRRRRGPEATEALRHGDPAVTSIHGAPSAEESALARERFALLMADLGRLPERPRGALLMRELSGLTHEEIATALETSVAAAKQCVYEARRDLADLAAGRATPCDEICRSISAGDRRVLRGRRVKAHLSDCPDCASFASAIHIRRDALHGMVPWLAVPAAITLLDRVLRGGSGGVASAGAGAAGGSAGAAGGSAGAAGGSAGAAGGSAAAAGGSVGATGGSAAVAGPLAAAGSAGQAAVAGGVVTKALGTSLLAKAVLATAAVSAGVLSVSGVGAHSHAAARPASLAHATTAPTVSGRRIASRSNLPASGASQRRFTLSARPAVAVAPPGHAKKTAGGSPPGQAKKGAGWRPPGQARKASGAAAPGQARKASGAAAPGHTRKASGTTAPGQARKAPGTTSPGQAKKASRTIAPGPARKASATVPRGQAKKAVGHTLKTSTPVAAGRAKQVVKANPASAVSHPLATHPATSAPPAAHQAASAAEQASAAHQAASAASASTPAASAGAVPAHPAKPISTHP